ncbi:MAG: RluA family pseudouridine synthase [Candidatus Beckwithbacteria bacterium]|nr:RluA family pseudouridine synthase [Patescibacteria group bacterium]
MVIKKIFEDKFLLVLNKPSGLVVNNSNSTGNMITLQDWLIEHEIGMGVERNGIVHRIDKETSGILIVAKTQVAMDFLQRQFKERKTTKMYMTMVHGKMILKEGRVTAPISRNPFNRTRFGVFVGGKEAETRYELVDMYRRGGQEFSYLKVFPKTGRTHQIRVHMKYLGHGVVSDEFYAGRKTARKDRLWCPRLFLQAVSLRIKHPVSGRDLIFEIGLANDLKKVLNSMEKD